MREEATDVLQGEKRIIEPGGAFGILLKGTAYGVRVIFPDSGSEGGLFDEIERFSNEAAHLSGVDMVFDFQGRGLSGDFVLRLLSEFVWPKGLRVLSWMSYDMDTLALLRTAGFVTGEPKTERRENTDTSSTSLMLTQSLRGGQRIEYDGDVVLLGHMHEGSEIWASGNVFVRGRLKGVVHAGADGGDYSVSAGSFEAAQVRLGDKICSSLGDDPRWRGKSVVISMEDGSLVARELKA